MVFIRFSLQVVEVETPTTRATATRDRSEASPRRRQDDDSQAGGSQGPKGGAGGFLGWKQKRLPWKHLKTRGHQSAFIQLWGWNKFKHRDFKSRRNRCNERNKPGKPQINSEHQFAFSLFYWCTIMISSQCYLYYCTYYYPYCSLSCFKKYKTSLLCYIILFGETTDTLDWYCFGSCNRNVSGLRFRAMFWS